MNFYPLLIQSIVDSRKLKLYLISNIPWIVVIMLTFIGWHLWWDTFFNLVKSNLTATAINGDTVKQLTEQIKNIAGQLLLFIPLWLIIWRIVQPVSIRAIENQSFKKYFSKSGYIFAFDIIKTLLIVLVYTIEKNTIFSQPLVAAIVLIIAIFVFSLLYFIQLAFYVEKPDIHISSLAAGWYHHLPEILFLHLIDGGVAIISFCVFGLILACFTYLPLFLFAILALLLSFGLGKLWVIRKMLWIHSIGSMLKLPTV